MRGHSLNQFILSIAGRKGKTDLILRNFIVAAIGGPFNMPLVLICGYPGSGKSTRALELFEHLKSLGKEVQIVNEESLNIDRTEGYKGAL